jgi:hypothetical protein
MQGSRVRTLLVLVAVFAVVLSGLTMTAHAAGVYGNFEIDGNKVDNAGPGDDWLTPNIGAVVFNDPASNSGCPAGTDDNFIGGGSTETSPGTWTFSCGNVPQKDDFTEAGILARRISDTEHWLFLYFNRVSGNGEAHLNFEFNKLSTTFDNDNDPSTPQIPERSNGDVLITLDAVNGGSVTKPNVYKWSGTRTSGNWLPAGGTQVQGTDWDVATDGRAIGSTSPRRPSTSKRSTSRSPARVSGRVGSSPTRPPTSTTACSRTAPSARTSI